MDSTEREKTAVIPTPGRPARIVRRNAFTLIELLVVVAVIASLLAILIPTLHMARERGQRAVCLSNLRQLTVAWLTYADDNDGQLVWGVAGRLRTSNSLRVSGWLGYAKATIDGEPNERLITGALWPYIRNIKLLHCPRGCKMDVDYNYAILPGANGELTEGTYIPDGFLRELFPRGRRVGQTVLRLTRLSDIVSPGTGERAVFMCTCRRSPTFYLPYLEREWVYVSPPPIYHANGVTLSMADGHAEYWKWQRRETLTLRRHTNSSGTEDLDYEGDNYRPQTEDGRRDIERLQKATWGKLATQTEGAP